MQSNQLSLFLVKMNAKLERTHSNAYQYKDQHGTPTNNGIYTTQQINNNRTTALEIEFQFKIPPRTP